MLGVDRAATTVALIVDLAMILILAAGSLRTLWRVGKILIHGDRLAPAVRDIWLHYAAWILLALEFALAADIIETAIAPSWTKIGQLGAIAAIRIALGFFLGRDISEYRGSEAR